MYRTANGNVALKMISETSKLQEEFSYNVRYTSRFYVPFAIPKFCTK